MGKVPDVPYSTERERSRNDLKKDTYTEMKAAKTPLDALWDYETGSSPTGDPQPERDGSLA